MPKLKSKCPVMIGDQIIGYVASSRRRGVLTMYTVRLIPRIMTKKLYDDIGMQWTKYSHLYKFIEIRRFEPLRLTKPVNLLDIRA